jgi:hypothetical protein
MQPDQLATLTDAVQYNCDVSDARHGGDYSLCVYLMKMREYFRWEQKLPYGARLGKDAVGDWLAAREERWEDLEDADLRPLSINGHEFDPFDAEAINRRLGDDGLVYSSGYGHRAKPHFFLGRLEQRVSRGGYTVYVAAGEYARDLTAPPAMTLGNSIFLRRESLRRMLWEKLESWRWNRPDNALGRAFACYDFDGDLEGSLDAMTDREIDNALLHEQGEVRGGPAARRRRLERHAGGPRRHPGGTRGASRARPPGRRPGDPAEPRRAGRRPGAALLRRQPQQHAQAPVSRTHRPPMTPGSQGVPPSHWPRSPRPDGRTGSRWGGT